MRSAQAPGVLPDAFTDPSTGRRINLLDWKAANLRASVLLGLAVFVLLGLIGYLLALAIDPESAILFVGVALLVAGGQNLVAYWFGDGIALAGAGARRATLEEQRYLVNITEAVAIGAGIPAPEIYVIDSSAPNAFATGRNPQNSKIAVTQGLLERLDRQELEGVVAHELAHIKNYDVLFMSLLAATVGAIVVLRDVVRRSLWHGGHRRGRSDRSGGQVQLIAYLVLLLLLVLAPVLALLLRLAVSRRREFLADATGAYLTRNPEGLARALEKLRDYRGEPLKASEGVQHMFFTNPLASLNAKGLFATHPPIEERIDRLRRM